MANNHATSDGGSSRRRSEQRDLAISVAVVAGAVLIGVALIVAWRRSAPQSHLSSSNADSREVASIEIPDATNFDSRLTATRARGGSGITEPPDVPEAGGVTDAATPPVEVQSGDTRDAANPPADSPRQVLKRMRQSARNGDKAAAIEASRQIASQVADPELRATLDRSIDEMAAAHGAGQAIDFDSLMDLIRNTIAPETWDSVGGPGTMEPFVGGVYVDATGLMRPHAAGHEATDLAQRRESARQAARQPGAGAVNQGSELRMISLPRLERAADQAFERGQPLPDDVRYLAGLTQVQYIFVYPEEQDIIVAGPAEAIRRDELGRVVGSTTGRAVLQLDDLVVVLRACFDQARHRGIFGCGIYPREERLAAVQQFLNASAERPIDPSQRDRWLGALRDQLGEQDIRIFGVPPGSRVAQVLVEADYRMKLVGIGIEQAAAPGIPSYFEIVGDPTPERLARGIDTLRWWFTMNYDAVLATPQSDAFELRGGRVRLLSENELLTATGQVVHTGQADAVNEQFARSFTDRFPELAARDLNFSDLAGIFDLAVVAGLLSNEGVPQQVGWSMSTFLDPDLYIVPIGAAPRTVESVINHRVYRGRHIMAAVSGGVMVNPWNTVHRDHRAADSDGQLARARDGGRNADTSRWWWD